MQFLTNTLNLIRFKVFRPRGDDALASIESRFHGKRIIGMSIGRRFKLCSISIGANGQREIQNVTEVPCPDFPQKVIPDSALSEIRALSKLNYAVVTVSDSTKSSVKTQSGLTQESEEASLISLSAEPKSTLTTADASSSWRVIHGEKASSIVGSMNSAIVTQLDADLAGIRIELARLAFTPVSGFNLLFADERVREKKAIPVLIDAGTVYAAPPVKARPWGEIRKLDSGAGTLYTSGEAKLNQWLTDTIIPQSVKNGGPKKVLILDMENSGDIQISEEIDHDIYFGDSEALDKIIHPEIHAATLC